jgi:hypothetical protein
MERGVYAMNWIPCDADNLPPAEIPGGMLMAVWYTYDNRFASYPRWLDNDETYDDVGEPGKDITYYLLVPKPDGVK